MPKMPVTSCLSRAKPTIGFKNVYKVLRLHFLT